MWLVLVFLLIVQTVVVFILRLTHVSVIIALFALLLFILWIAGAEQVNAVQVVYGVLRSK